ncbi:MAG TPA: DUF6603 domain-containing protein [Solirubrobacteraceae bacterium]
MPTEPGTFERVVTVLSGALEPLARDLQPENAMRFLGEMGLYLGPDSLSPQLRSALGATATAATRLPDLVTDLAAALEADAEAAEIVAKSVPLAAQIVVLIDSLDGIATEFSAVGGAVPGIDPADLSAFVADLPANLLQRMLVEFFEREAPAATGVLALLGVVERTRQNVGSSDPLLPEGTLKTLRLDRLGTVMQDPGSLIHDLYAWGDPGFDGGALIDRLHELLAALRLPVARYTTEAPPRPGLQFPLATLEPTTGVNPPGLEGKIVAGLAEGWSLTIPLGSGLELEFTVGGSVQAAVGLRIQPPATFSLIPPSGSVQGTLSAGVAKVPEPPATAVTILGAPGGSRLEAQRIGGAIAAEFAWAVPSGPASGDFGVDGRVQGGKLVISLGGADGFIGTLLGDIGLEADFDVGFRWRAGTGITFTGSGALEIQLPAHIALGPIEITAITLQLGMRDGGFPIALSTDIKGALGPLAAVVERIGAEIVVSFPPAQDGNLGPVQLDVGFKPPNGVGLSLDVGVVRGGGYLFIDAEKGEYAGALELMLAEIVTVKAIALINTRMPDGRPGFSLLIIITAEFGTGIQLGFGFVLLGVGGLVGFNRTMNLQALMEGVRTNAVESVMFPRDVIANAPRILSDLRALFPPQEGKFLIGPMVKLGWGTPPLITASVGVIIEIPGNIAIVGVIKIALPTQDAALVVLQVNFAGALEFDRQRLYFFASLFESRILFMTIEGELGLLVAWGDDANFVLSVGGFHPQFTPPPLPFPSPRRVSIDILNQSAARIRVSGYFAVTSNTAQFGASAELFFGFSGFSLQGHIGFDALFRFSPFSFVIEISASVSLKAFGVGVFSIRLHFELSGPTPWRARGTGSISLLFFDIEADFDITWGDQRDTAMAPIDVLPIVVEALGKAEAWKAQLPPGNNLLVSLRAFEATPEELVLHPLGTLEVRQRAVPLDLTIDKVGSQRAGDVNHLSLAPATNAFVERGDLDERFPLAQFKEMSDAEKLSRAAFEAQHAGLGLSVGDDEMAASRAVLRSLRYEEIVIDNQFRRRRRRFEPLALLLFTHFLDGNSLHLNVLSAAQQKLVQPFDDRIAITGDSYAVASTVDNTLAAGTTMFASEALAHEYLAAQVGAQPALAGTLQVLHAAEVNA